MAIRDGKRPSREVHVTMVQDKRKGGWGKALEGDDAGDPAQVKAAKSAAKPPEEAAKPTKRSRPPEK